MLHLVLSGNSSGVIDVTEQLSQDVSDLSFVDDGKSTNEQRTLGSRSILALLAVWDFKDGIYLFYEDGDFLSDLTKPEKADSIISGVTD